MKRTMLVALAFLLALTLFACGSKDELYEGGSKDAEPMDQELPALEESFFFTSNGFDIMPYNTTLDDAEAALGEPNGTYEGASCAYQGSDLYYYYSGFELTFNELDADGVQRVSAISIVDDTVKTPEGIYIGMPEDELAALLGDEFAIARGEYSATRGSTMLDITVKDASVAAIVYTYYAE